MTLLLVIGLLGGIVLHPTGYLQPVENVVFTVLAPLQYSFHWISVRIAHGVQTLRDLRTLQSRIQELQDTVDRLMIENVRLREAEIERTILREQLQFKLANPTYELLAAEVIGRDPSNLLQYIIIDRGANDGVAVGMPVVTARGLVGRVTSVYPQSARVMLLTDPASSVNALIQSSRATGVVQGQGQRGLVMRYIEQSEQVAVGDIVLTSGLGGNFPKRLVIGQVTAVKRNDVEMFQEVQVQSAVRFDRLEIVLVVQNFVPIDYAP
ncbi:MAG: rod shape-determining protein MreC [Chloroflexi bacterium]|nr:rod shape-determining protein MreC [Chloroflexota bacterium]